MDLIQKKILEANKAYADKYEAQPSPIKKFAILTCMDARLDPVRFAGLVEDAYIIRNAGGRASDDAIRSLVISYKFLGSKEWFVIHHTDCGMNKLDNGVIGCLFEESLEAAEETEEGWKNTCSEGGSLEGHYMNFLPIADIKQAIIDDVWRIRNHPLVSPHVSISGYIYDVATGLLHEVPEATSDCI